MVSFRMLAAVAKLLPPESQTAKKLTKALTSDMEEEKKKDGEDGIKDQLEN